MKMPTPAAPHGSSRRRRAVQWVAYLISALCILYLYHDFNWREEIPRLRAVHWRWIALAVICDFLVYVIHAWRWNTLLRPLSKVPFWRTLQAIYIGLLANELLPFKSGEIVRCYLVGHWDRIPFSKVLSSGMIERLMDGVILLVGLVCIIPIGELRKDGRLEAGAFGLFALVLLLGTIVAFGILNKNFARHVSTRHRWSEPLRMVAEGLYTMGRSRTFPLAFLGSIAYLGLQLVPVYSLLAGYRLNLGWRQALLVLVITRLGTIVPAAPSNIGVFHLFAIFALHNMLHVEHQTAMSVAGLMFAVITLPLIAGGCVALAATGSDIREIYVLARAQFHHLRHEHKHKAGTH